MEEGKCFALMIEKDRETLYKKYDPEFEAQVMMFEGFMESAMQLGRDYSEKGYKHLDFGLIRFCVTQEDETIFLVVTNENTSKKEGYQTLSNLINAFNEQNGLEEVLIDANKRLRKIHNLRQNLVNLLEDKKISSDLIELDKFDLGINLNISSLLEMDSETQKQKLEELLSALN